MTSLRLAALLGDGIGPDIVEATTRVLQRSCERRGIDLDFDFLPSGLAALEAEGSTLPHSTLEALPDYPGWLLGPVSHHAYPSNTDARYVNPSGFLRKHHELYANVRPARSFEGVRAFNDRVDLVLVRENTEGFYADRNLVEGEGEFKPDPDTVLSLRVVTRRASTRLAHRAFELAAARDRGKKVTIVHKANVLSRGDGLFLECCREVAEHYPDVSIEDYHVDACAMALVSRPEEFDVIATTNMFGDILSDEAAGLVGGLGLAPGLNVGDQYAMAQATHGSAPDIAHLGIANPVAEILSGKLLLDWLAQRLSINALREAASNIERAVEITLREGKALTPDLGGNKNTHIVTEAILEHLDMATEEIS